MPVLSKLETSPSVVLEQIVLSLVETSFLGPPADLLSLLLVSKPIWKVLSLRNNPHLYGCIYGIKFDVRATVRRLGDECEHASELADELVRRCEVIKRLRDNTYPIHAQSYARRGDTLRIDLWTAYLMFIESDGKNAKQLINYARIGTLALRSITPGGRFHNGTEANGGWTVDNEVNALLAWLFWLTDKERVQSETPAERETILQAFAHLYVGSFKYPSAHAPITSFFIPPTRRPVSPPALSLTLAASPPSPPCMIPDHFGWEITVACPLLTQAALLSCVVRLEAAAAETDLLLPPHIPATRADAIATGWQGPTREDHHDQNQATTKLVDWEEEGGADSRRHEHDWMRLRTCYDPWSLPGRRDRVFTPGMLHGLWVGRWFEIPVEDFMSIIHNEQAGQVATIHRPLQVHPVPMQLHLREHHQDRRRDIVDFDDMSCDDTGKGVFNAWLPAGTTTSEREGELQVSVPGMREPETYRTYDPLAAAQAALDEEIPGSREHEGVYGAGVWDIILTAETDDTFGNVWGHRRYHGRVRDWDGLVVLVREAMNGEGQWIFRGYVHGNQNLVGRWRETRTLIGAPGWEGVWSVTKKE